ncbi:MAG: hypothetical protein K2W94_01635 [Alphaproteobacteria bacterium]|nr:hypothetical protein [Alphaproteobacteria bacterium]
MTLRFIRDIFTHSLKYASILKVKPLTISIKMVLLFTKRVLVLFGAALLTLVCDAEPAHGMDKVAATKNCENGLKSLEQQKCRLVKEISGAYGKTVQDINGLIVKLKAANEPQIILSLSKDCQDGLAAIDWLITRYGKPARTSGVKEVSAPDSGEWLPIQEREEPAKIKEEKPKAKVDEKLKRRPISKRSLHPKFIKVSKKPTLQKPIVSVKARGRKPAQSNGKMRRSVTT